MAEEIDILSAKLDKNPMDKAAMERLFEYSSNEISKLKEDPSIFNETTFTKYMRIIKREINKKLKELGVYDKSPNPKYYLNPRFSDFCMNMIEAMGQHSVGGNYPVALAIALELYDNINIYATEKAEPKEAK